MSCADRMAKITCLQHVSSWGADNSVFMRLSARCFSRHFVPDPLHGEARWLFADSYARPSTGIVSLAAAKCALSTFGIISRKVCAYLPLRCFILTVSARLCSIPSPGNYAWPILARLSCSPHGVLSRKRAVCKAMSLPAFVGSMGGSSSRLATPSRLTASCLSWPGLRGSSETVWVDENWPDRCTLYSFTVYGQSVNSLQYTCVFYYQDLKRVTCDTSCSKFSCTQQSASRFGWCVSWFPHRPSFKYRVGKKNSK